ncbi:hypothetical protein ROHU_005401 [Labeo rohita]|uniref:Uncharacterized protein n=1 Tax=Labeo rohita TaxID=84645 RepID=A0A498N116_LABRO|nr:hypothetical protein ROHU_005401 [Labeo rohita]
MQKFKGQIKIVFIPPTTSNVPQHSVRSFSYYITDPLSDPPQQSACRRITPFPTVTAGEPPAPSRPPLYSTCHTISPDAEAQPRFHCRNVQLPRHPRIIRPRQQFLRSESGQHLSPRQTLINSDASLSRKVNKWICTIYSSPSKSANLTPKSTPAAKAANRSSKATIVPHKIRLLANIGSQQQAFNEPGPRPSSHPTHSLPALAQPFTAALPAAAPLEAGPLASVSRG